MFTLSGRYTPPQLKLDPDQGGTTSLPPKEASPLDAGAYTVASTSSEDEAPPDFGALEEKFGDGKPPEPAVVTPETKPEPAAPATGKEDHPSDPRRYADGTFKEKQKGDTDTEVTFPEIKPSKPEEKKVEDKKPEEKKTEAEVKPAVKAEEPKKEEKPLPGDDKDIESMEPKPTASEKTKNDFKALKEIAKASRESARQLQRQIEEIKAKSTGELPPEIKEKVEGYDELLKFRQMFEAENEPKSRAEYSSRLESAEKKIIDALINDPRLQLPKEKADKLKSLGFDSPEAIQMRNGWFQQIRKNTGDELLVQEVAELFRERERVVKGRADEVAQLKTNRDAYLKSREEKEKGEFNEWGSEADKTLVELSKGHDWTDYMKIPDGATPEQLAVINSHNDRVKSEIVPAFNKSVLDVFHRKPAETVKTVFDAMRARYELEPEIASLKTTLAEKDARIAELEKLANGVRRAGSFSTAEGAPPAGAKATPNGITGSKEASSDESIDAYLASKGIR